MIPESEYITVERRDPGYGSLAVTVESIGLHHGSGARESFAEWWETNGRFNKARTLPALPSGMAGVYVEDYLVWADQFEPSARPEQKPRCRWCKDTGEITINFKTEPCVDCHDVRVMGWIDGSDTGTSSQTIWHILTKLPGKVFRYGVPKDADDFGKCARLLKYIPEWVSRLGEVVDRCSEWKGVVANWDRLTNLYTRGDVQELNILLRRYARS